MYTLKDIFIYPIKSMGGIALDSSMALIRGFEHDRRMMLVDGAGHFLSQRRVPAMAAFRLSMKTYGFQVEHQGEKLDIPFDLKLNKPVEVRIWDDRLKAPTAPDSLSQWFSRHLDLSCRLVVMDKGTIRQVDRKYAQADETVSFSDGFPYLMIGTASLDDLNKKLSVPVNMGRFRPNLVIATDTPFIEDKLEIFGIGGAIFKRSKPCSRCVVTTTDQMTGIRGKEPLVTLSTYRKEGNKVYFGQNLLCLRPGKVSAGDPIDLNVNILSI